MSENNCSQDNVNYPPHYDSGKYECFDVMESVYGIEVMKGFCLGNVFKYVWRYDKKGKPLEDLEKAGWYLARLIEYVDAEEGS